MVSCLPVAREQYDLCLRERRSIAHQPIPNPTQSGAVPQLPTRTVHSVLNHFDTSGGFYDEASI